VPEQTGTIIADLDGNGVDDVVVYGRRGSNSVQWYRRSVATGEWTLDIIESAELSLEAGATSGDVNGDGDIDLIIGRDFSGVAIYWWENPGDAHVPGADWVRRTLLTTGGPRHHDLVFADVDHDGRSELVFWTQGRAVEPVNDLFVAEVPDDPTQPGDWPVTRLLDADVESEGIGVGDVDNDGRLDIVAGGQLLSFDDGTGQWATSTVSDYTDGRYVVADLIPGGWREIVVASGDEVGPLEVLSWTGTDWTVITLVARIADGGTPAGPWRIGHSLDVADINADGHLDVFSAEMYLLSLFHISEPTRPY